MNLGDIDLSKKIPVQDLWLCKPDRTIIAKITQQSGIGGRSRFGKRHKLLKHTILYKLNNISELEFSIPYLIEVNHELVRNPLVDQIRDFYLIKSIHNSVEEWFTITDVKKNTDMEKDVLTLTCRSLGYELIRRTVRNYKVVSGNLSSLISTGGTTVDSKGNTVPYNSILSGSLWSLDPNYDHSFDTIYRYIDISKATVLDALISIARTFNAILQFDTVNRRINFQQLANIGQDKGLKVSYGRYLKSLENDSKSDLLATRFIPIGKGGLTINSVSPNGQSYYDCFDWFTNGFTRDINKNVLTSSPYMSNSLCGALADYTDLLASKNGQYTTLLNSLTTYQMQLTTKNNEMTALVTTLNGYKAQLVVAQTSGTSTTTLLSQISSQNALIATKQSEIDAVNANITSTNNSISALQATLSTSANFTNAQVQELLPFIFEKEYVDDKISSAQELYNQGLIKFESYKSPQIVIKIDMINIFEDLLSQYDWSKLVLGDTILIEYNVLGTSVKAKIIEIQFDHQAGNISLSIATISDILRNEEAVFNMLYKGVSANNTISVNLDTWNSVDTVNKNVNAIYNNNILGSKIAINAGVSNNITINSLGLTSIVASSPNNIVRLSNGNLGFSIDNGNTYATAINAQGVNAAVITGQILLGANLNIANQSGSVTIDGNGMTVTSMNLTLTRSDLNSRILLDPTNGIKIQAKSGGVFVDKFYANGVGDIFANSLTLATPSINNGSLVGTTLNVNNQFIVDAVGNLTANSVSLTGSISATGGSIGGFTISSTKLSGSGLIEGGTISGTTINTAASGRRITLSGNAMVAYDGGGNRRISVNDPAFGLAAESSVAFFRSNGTTLAMNIYQTGTQTIISSGSDTISYNGTFNFNLASNFDFTNVATAYFSGINATSAIVGGVNVITSLNGKVNSGASTSSIAVSDGHNHGFSTSDYIQCYDSLGVATLKKQWVPYSGSSGHSHTI